jgi:hypothetical protein
MVIAFHVLAVKYLVLVVMETISVFVPQINGWLMGDVFATRTALV